MKNPPAFPQPINPAEQGRGMNLRDYFAAKGLEALMVAVTSELQSKHHSNEKAHEIKMLYAKTCYAMADAMMKAREE
jgi:hypothetical protein